jgi:hypothetical protein
MYLTRAYAYCPLLSYSGLLQCAEPVAEYLLICPMRVKTETAVIPAISAV